jgi:isopenicillin N synthase-like dioxygenase
MAPYVPLGAAVVALASWIANRMGASAVPLIELDGTASSRAALLDAASRLGVVRVRMEPHVSRAAIDNALEASAALFALDEDVKRAWPVVRFPPVPGIPPPIARGYIPFGGESGVSSSFFEMKEGYAYSHEAAPVSLQDSHEDTHHGSHVDGCVGQVADAAGRGTPSSPLQFCNAWPPGQPAFRAAASRALDGMHAIAQAAARELAIALGALDAGEALVSSVEDGLPSSVMRLFHYHSEQHCSGANRTECAARGARVSTGSSPHTDWHALTVICEGRRAGREPPFIGRLRRLLGLGPPRSGGLQFRPRGSSRWLDVRASSGEAVLIVGDLLALASRGTLHSPVHRVLLPAERGASRTSFTLFAYPRAGDSIADWVRMLDSGMEEVPAVDAIVEEARRAAGTAQWNTLLAQAGADAGAREPFERILLRKWRGVSTLPAEDREEEGAAAAEGGVRSSA